MSSRPSFPKRAPRTSLVIPALNEAESIILVLEEIPPGLVDETIVVDNGSTDDTATVARKLGARVLFEPKRGYGAACLAGVAAAHDPDIIVFMDADYSDDPREIPLLTEPIVAGKADLVIGSRVLGRRERGALRIQARLGNALATLLIRLFWGRKFTDLGPFRAISADAYRRLDISDDGYGYPVQTQIRALTRGLRVLEVPVSYRRRRMGRSKISGTLKGIFRAGRAILENIFREFFLRNGA